MDREKVDSYTNTFTAIVIRHIDNDPELLLQVDAHVVGEQEHIAAEQIKELFGNHVEDFLYTHPAPGDEPYSLLHDLTEAAFNQVNWQEIVRHRRRRLLEDRYASQGGK